MKKKLIVLGMTLWLSCGHGWGQAVQSDDDSCTYPSLQAIMIERSIDSLSFTKGKHPVFQLPKTHLPLFCKIEKKWDNKSQTQLRFRLGDVETVNTLEGK